MQLRLPVELGAPYKSPTQRVRVITEAWGEENLYCSNCSSNRLTRSVPGTEASDFICPDCDNRYELKSQSRAFAQRIADAAYASMRRAIQRGQTPNLLALHYDPNRWHVRTLLLIPRFAYSLSAIEGRKPTLPKGRRNPWVGCDIALDRIPPDARIPVIFEGRPASMRSVRERFARLRPLARQRYDNRGWTLDMLRVLRSMGRREFALHDVYAFAEELGELHPRNRHVEAKIRQQLQRLRDLGFLEFVERGNYRLRA